MSDLDNQFDAAKGSAPDGFQPHRPKDEPMMTGGHQPGKLVGNDAAPEFHVQTLPAGTAPPESTFKPNNENEIPPSNNSTSASETIGGATSSDVNAGLGKPIQGQSSAELRHDGQSHRKAAGTGGHDGQLSGAQGNTVDSHLPENADQRALDNDKAKPRAQTGGAPAEDKI